MKLKMDFRFANLKRWLPVVGAVAAAVSFAQAQTLMTPGQPIIFSAPDDGNAASSTPSLAAEPPVAPGFADMIHAPEFNFKNPPITSTPMPAPTHATVSSAEADRRANWALMTPAEILGVATPEQELKIPERDAAGQRKNPTVVERYYERQDQAQTNGGGGFLSGTPPLRGNFSDNEDARWNASGFTPAGGGFGNPAQSADSFQQPAPGNGTAASQNEDTGWSENIVSPEATPAQSPSQAADMAEFRKLLEPGQPSKPSASGGFFSSPQTLPGSTFGQQANPAGAPFGSFNNTAGLPGVAGQIVVPTATAVPDWKPQPAPWMLKGPQPDAIPKRVVF